MKNLVFSVVEHKEEKLVFGLSKQSNDQAQAKDIPALSKRYYEILGKKDGEVIPFFVISSGYDTDTKNFQLFVGGLVENANLETFVLPKGVYGKVTIEPKLGFMWGLSIGRAKRAFYTEWLPKSEYASLNMEYEYHSDISKSKNPHIDILFAIEKNSRE